MDSSQGDGPRTEVAEKEERFGLVRWHSLKVVPLSCVREKTKIVLDHLPIRCKCEWDRLEHYVELVEVSGERWARAMHTYTVGTKRMCAHVRRTHGPGLAVRSRRAIALSPFRNESSRID